MEPPAPLAPDLNRPPVEFEAVGDDDVTVGAPEHVLAAVGEVDDVVVDTAPTRRGHRPSSARCCAMPQSDFSIPSRDARPGSWGRRPGRGRVDLADAGDGDLRSGTVAAHESARR